MPELSFIDYILLYFTCGALLSCFKIIFIHRGISNSFDFYIKYLKLSQDPKVRSLVINFIKLRESKGDLQLWLGSVFLESFLGPFGIISFFSEYKLVRHINKLTNKE